MIYLEDDIDYFLPARNIGPRDDQPRPRNHQPLIIINNKLNFVSFFNLEYMDFFIVFSEKERFIGKISLQDFRSNYNGSSVFDTL